MTAGRCWTTALLFSTRTRGKGTPLRLSPAAPPASLFIRARLLPRFPASAHGTNPARGRLRLGTDFTVVPFGVVTGELRIKSPSVFQEYLGNRKETAAAFDEDGGCEACCATRRAAGGTWTLAGSDVRPCLCFFIYVLFFFLTPLLLGYFMTGDIAEYHADLDAYAIAGRASVDIIKSGGCVPWPDNSPG